MCVMLAVVHDIRSLDIVDCFEGPFDDSLVACTVQCILNMSVQSRIPLANDRSGRVYVSGDVVILLMLPVYYVYWIIIEYDSLLDCNIIGIIRRVAS